MKAPQKKSDVPMIDDSILSSIVTTGDLSRLTAEQKVIYYRQFCERLGLDPISQPFKLLKLNGREILYCDRSGAQQLNKLHHVSHEIKARETVSGCYVVTAQASTPDGRRTESIGATPIENMRGDALCNALMKAETKAKRRATLDLLGLGILDETEADSIAPQEAKLPAPVEGPTTTKAAAPTAEPAQPSIERVISEPAATELFKIKYKKASEIEEVLGRTNTLNQLADLYYINLDAIEKNAALKALFSARKKEVTNNSIGANAVAA